MGVVFNSSKTADTVNRAIDNSMGTTTTTQGAAAAGKIITEDLQPVVQCTGGYTNPFIVKTISGVPPVEFHAVEGNLKFWAISGNTVEGVSVGDKTANLWDIASWIIANGSTYTKEGNSYTFDTTLAMHSTPYYFSETDIAVSISGILENVSAESVRIDFLHSDGTVSSGDVITDTKNKSENIYAAGLRFNWSTGGTVTLSNIMVNTGSTALSYEPFGYKVPIECAGITYNCYISDVLRKSTPVERKRKSKKAVNDTTVYDIMDSTGTVTRNVDTDGSPLETPVTESYTAPTISTIWGYNEFDVDTTVTPSNVTVQYYDN